jgi:transcriptional regulator
VYIPKHFAVAEQSVVHELMRRFSFATLVTQREGRLLATHLPLLLHADDGEQGALIGHMARANEQWQDFAPEVEALAIFQGHHAYISPSWYETAPSVPTWNYMVAHASGTPRVIEDERRVREILAELVAANEARFEQPWPMDLPEDYLRHMQHNIVAFEMPITRLEGKFKLSQNQSAANRQRVIEALAGSTDAGDQALASEMRGMP